MQDLLDVSGLVYDGQPPSVISGPLSHIINRLAHETTPDEWVIMFLASHDEVIDGLSLFLELITRYVLRENILGKIYSLRFDLVTLSKVEAIVNRRDKIQQRIITTIQLWITKFYAEFSNSVELLAKLEEFINKLEREKKKNFSTLLRKAQVSQSVHLE